MPPPTTPANRPLAPAQGPGQPGSAVATQTQNATALQREGEVTTDMALSAFASGRDIERVVAEVTIPSDFQYVIEKNVNVGTRDHAQWQKQVAKVGITADGYDYLNRALGATFFFPDWVHDEKGERARNPIHRSDYIYLRMGVVYYTPIGQLVSTVEDIEVDFKLMYQDKRANARSAVPLLDDHGQLMWDAAGNPGLKLSPEDELKCLRELTRARAFGPRYAATVGRVRLLKMATGIRSLPNVAAGRAFKVQIVAYRDKLDPEQRINKAAGDLNAQYGGSAPDEASTQRPDLQPLSREEADEVGLSEDMRRPDIDEAEREHVAEARANEGAVSGEVVEPGSGFGQGEAKPIGAPWSDEELGDLR